jgi:uncharacterized protein
MSHPPIDPELKKILACPRCKKQHLEWHESEGELHCLECKVRYAIEDGVPVMLVDQARPLSS